MKLTTKKRTGSRKGENNGIRREGDIPAVVYSHGKENVNVTVDGHDFKMAISHIQKGHLSNTVFELDGEASCKAVVKDIQYHRTTYNVLHLDLLELRDDLPIIVNVPIEYTGAVDCIGVKAGGVLRSVIRKLKVKCLPKNMPKVFLLEVQDLNLNQGKRLSEIELGQGVKDMADLNEVAVIVAKR